MVQIQNEIFVTERAVLYIDTIHNESIHICLSVDSLCIASMYS